MNNIFSFAEFSPKIASSLAFILEIDNLKSILRQNHILSDRRENSAEHSWHVVMTALVLSEYSNEKINIEKTLKMLLIHDIVEIDAGDTFVYADIRPEEKFEKELAAAKRIFGLLPETTAQELYELWIEFENRESNEAKFAAAVDRILPILLNVGTQGKTWLHHGIDSGRIMEKNKHIAEGSKELWTAALEMIRFAEQNGYTASIER